MIFTMPYITQTYSWYNGRTDCGREDKIEILINLPGLARVGFLGYGFFGFFWVNPIFINSWDLGFFFFLVILSNRCR